MRVIVLGEEGEDWLLFDALLTKVTELCMEKPVTDRLSTRGAIVNVHYRPLYYLFTFIFIYLFTFLFIYLFIHLSIHVSSFNAVIKIFNMYDHGRHHGGNPRPSARCWKARPRTTGEQTSMGWTWAQSDLIDGRRYLANGYHTLTRRSYRRKMNEKAALRV